MSKIADQLRELRVFNTHEILSRFGAKGLDVAALYVTPSARSVMARATMIYSPSHQTNPNAAWYDNGCKSFVGTKEKSMPKAIAWASEKYGITEWATCPFDRSAKIPAEVLTAAKEAVKSGESRLKRLDYTPTHFRP